MKELLDRFHQYFDMAGGLRTGLKGGRSPASGTSR